MCGSREKINNFVFKKNTDLPLNLPLKYKKYFFLDGFEWHVHSKRVTTFEHIGPLPEWEGEAPDPTASDLRTLHGDLELFNFFKDNHLFYRFGEKYYRSLIEKK